MELAKVGCYPWLRCYEGVDYSIRRGSAKASKGIHSPHTHITLLPKLPLLASETRNYLNLLPNYTKSSVHLELYILEAIRLKL